MWTVTILNKETEIQTENFLKANGYQNKLDENLFKSCPVTDKSYVNGIASLWYGYYKDRAFKLSCHKGPVDVTQCNWTSDWQNDFNQILNYSCPQNWVLTGLASHHDNGPNDRRWHVQCCKLEVELDSCQWTGDLNEHGQNMNHTLDPNKVITAVYNKPMGGRWKRFVLCS